MMRECAVRNEKAPPQLPRLLLLLLLLDTALSAFFPRVQHPLSPEACQRKVTWSVCLRVPQLI
jgi:hypothetical protein